MTVEMQRLGKAAELESRGTVEGTSLSQKLQYAVTSRRRSTSMLSSVFYEIICVQYTRH